VTAPIITAGWLRERGACTGQVERFRSLWPSGAAVTPEHVRRALADGLDVAWLLSPDLRAEYDRAIAPAEAEYDRATAPAGAEYDRARDSILLSLLLEQVS
jgi:hypothetical protein